MGLAEGLRRFFILPASPYGRICCRCCGHCAGPFRNLRLTLHLPVPPASSPHPRGSARASSARVACQGRRPPSAAHPPSRHASAAGHTAQRPLGDCDGSLSLSLYAAVEVCWFGDHPCQQVNMGREWGSHARLRPAACVLAPRRRATACLISFSVEQVERSIRATAKPSINPRKIADRSMCFCCCARILIDAVVNQPLCFAESRKVVVKNSRCNRPLGTKILSPNIRLLGYPSLHTRRLIAVRLYWFKYTSWKCKDSSRNWPTVGYTRLLGARRPPCSAMTGPSVRGTPPCRHAAESRRAAVQSAAHTLRTSNARSGGIARMFRPFLRSQFSAITPWRRASCDARPLNGALEQLHLRQIAKARSLPGVVPIESLRSATTGPAAWPDCGASSPGVVACRFLAWQLGHSTASQRRSAGSCDRCATFNSRCAIPRSAGRRFRRLPGRLAGTCANARRNTFGTPAEWA